MDQPDSTIQIPRFCFEYLVNGFHLMGHQNCPVCRSTPTLGRQSDQFELARREYEQQRQKAQSTFLDLEQQFLREKEEANQILEASTEKQSELDEMLDLYEKYKNCECCKGIVFNCNGEICFFLGQCYCYGKDQQEDQ